MADKSKTGSSKTNTANTSRSNDPAESLFRLDGGESSLVISAERGSPPQMVYWGRQLPDGQALSELVHLSVLDTVHGAEQTSIPLSLTMEPGLGLLGPSGLQAHCDGQVWASLFVVERVAPVQHGISVICVDERSQLSVHYDICMQPNSGVLSIDSRLFNQGKMTLDVQHMASACLPVSRQMTDILGFSGRWSGEFQTERVSRFAGGYVRENRRGRSSADCFPGVFLGQAETSESHGQAYGFHLAWSGNHQLRVDTLRDGRVVVSMGSLLLPGEVRLDPGQCLHNPTLVAAYSQAGWSGVSRCFHHFVRHQLLRKEVLDRPRPVHLNVWEAVYFNHDINMLKQLAEQAAALGVERFVLDDGWFGARRHDRAGLGDWQVSADVYPAGLGPLVDHVTQLGMEMGIWFEPEMVNPDSDLYRAHPDWVLQIERLPQIPFRHQLVLDLTRPEVTNYLFDAVDAILSEYDIRYVKWDMNRDLNHPGGERGEPRAAAQVTALWALIDRLRTEHPTVEFESCSSGGARADFGMLRHTDRVWTSDNNDALERQIIQRGASYFLPLNVIGAHVGPGTSHQTARRLPMQFRAATALMGHMGLELNLLQEPEADLQILQQAIALYKEVRHLLHSGLMYRLPSETNSVALGVVAEDRSEAIYSYAYMISQTSTHAERLYFQGISPEYRYRLQLRWPLNWTAPGAAPDGAWRQLNLQQGCEFSGAALLYNGLQLPSATPQTVLLFHLEVCS